jgi:hypothetical protein
MASIYIFQISIKFIAIFHSKIGIFGIKINHLATLVGPITIRVLNWAFVPTGLSNAYIAPFR